MQCEGSCSKLLIQNAVRCNILISILSHQNCSFSLLEGEFFCYRQYSGALGTGERAEKEPNDGVFTLTLVVF